MWCNTIHFTVTSYHGLRPLLWLTIHVIHITKVTLFYQFSSLLGKVWLLRSVSEGIWGKQRQYLVFQVLSPYSKSNGVIFSIGFIRISIVFLIFLRASASDLSPHVCCSLLAFCEGILSASLTACWEFTIKKSYYAVLCSLDKSYKFWTASHAQNILAIKIKYVYMLLLSISFS